MSKQRIYGVRFKEPSCPFEDLISTSVFGNFYGIIAFTLTLLPLIGTGAIISSLGLGYIHRNDNRFGGAQVAWKVGIYGIVIQTIYALTFLVVYL